jgi:hypothetical protein
VQVENTQQIEENPEGMKRIRILTGAYKGQDIRPVVRTWQTWKTGSITKCLLTEE